MKIDLCRLFGVEEGEEFKLKLFGGIGKYRLKNGKLEYYDDFINKWVESTISMNHILDSEIIKIPKKKQFSQDELCVLKNIDKKYKWIARDKVCKDEYDDYGNLNIYLGKPNNKSTVSWLPSDEYCEFHAYNHLFQSIKWDDEEPVYIDDYVER